MLNGLLSTYPSCIALFLQVGPVVHSRAIFALFGIRQTMYCVRVMKVESKQEPRRALTIIKDGLAYYLLGSLGIYSWTAVNGPHG